MDLEYSILEFKNILFDLKNINFEFARLLTNFDLSANDHSKILSILNKLKIYYEKVLTLNSRLFLELSDSKFKLDSINFQYYLIKETNFDFAEISACKKSSFLLKILENLISCLDKIMLFNKKFLALKDEPEQLERALFEFTNKMKEEINNIKSLFKLATL